MPDRLTEVLQNHIERLRASVEMMEAGKLRTHTNNQDTTQESIDQNRVWIAELEEALARHEARNA